jgi:drug/metabolite transporter (DMT)-like permease
VFNGLKIETLMVAKASLTFFGIVLVINPTGAMSVLRLATPIENPEEAAPIDWMYAFGIFCGASAGFFGNWVNMLIGQLSQHMTPVCSTYYFGLFAILYGGCHHMISDYVPWSTRDLCASVGLYVASVLVQILLYFANKLERRLSYISILMNMQVVLGFFFSWW